MLCRNTEALERHEEQELRDDHDWDMYAELAHESLIERGLDADRTSIWQKIRKIKEDESTARQRYE